MTERIVVVGLGYVGLPVALAMARAFPETRGFDVNAERVDALARGEDCNGEVPAEVLRSTPLRVTADPSVLGRATCVIIAVPTPVDAHNVPDLCAVTRATETVGRWLKPGGLVVYESTVYPGVTEEVCGPILAQASGLPRDAFKLGYSPERINPGDREHTFEKIAKVVSGEDAATLERVAAIYGRVVTAGVHRAPSIKVAEAAKVIENIQRDLNIALMNELAIIFDRMDIRTSDVLAAAATKWNFLPFRPGLVGGHCIGVDPYYLTTKAQQLGYQPRVILAGRSINNEMGRFVAQRLVKLLIHADIPVKGARVGILGVTFKENCSDLRNSKVPDIVAELGQFGIRPLVHDPVASPSETKAEYGIELSSVRDWASLDALVLAVQHDAYRAMGTQALASLLRDGGVLVDVKSAIDPSVLGRNIHYWSL